MKIPQDGELTHVYQCLWQAIEAGLFTTEPERMGEVFFRLSLGMRGMEPDTSPYLQEEEAKRNFRQIQALAERNREGNGLTRDEKSSLGRSMVHLLLHVAGLKADK